MRADDGTRGKADDEHQDSRGGEDIVDDRHEGEDEERMHIGRALRSRSVRVGLCTHHQLAALVPQKSCTNLDACADLWAIIDASDLSAMVTPRCANMHRPEPTQTHKAEIKTELGAAMKHENV